VFPIENKEGRHVEEEEEEDEEKANMC